MMEEMFDLLDEKGNKTGLTKSRSAVHRDGDLHGTVHVWVVRKTADGFDVLLQRRSENKKLFPGCLDFSCAGHLSAGETPAEGARRELREELGVSAAPDDLVWLFQKEIDIQKTFSGQKFRDRELIQVYLYDPRLPTPQIRAQEEEISETVWLRDDGVLKLAQSGEGTCLDEYEVRRVLDILRAQKKTPENVKI
jgi:8-oxo-dGTP diphosphatase